MIDTHCHLDFESFDEDRSEVIERAIQRGISKMITIGCEPKDFEKTIQITQDYKNIFCTLGIHPNSWKEMSEENFEKLERLCKEYKGDVVGFGESGLDYYWSKDLDNFEEIKEIQKESFLKHMILTHLYKKPIVIHTRDAEEDTLDILKKNTVYKGVIHCFTGSMDFALEILKMPEYMISFSGIITFKNAKELHEVVKIVPLERIMIETDSPYLAPTPQRGKRNEPAFVEHVAEHIAALKNISFQEVVELTTQNAEKFWDIEKK